ncbi:MAG: pyrroline-5-carboxylate reductase [Planctomycetota bacterium]|nr:MAG: pyrroline-5-carboxylate reductase [Planctomycetota bacterium]
MTNLATCTIGFIGAGRMATALAKGIVAAGVVEPERIIACDVSASAAESFSQTTGGRIAGDAAAVCEAADVLVLAVKPQHMEAVLDTLAGRIRDDQLVVTIAAGIPMARYLQRLGEGVRLVRVMPNTPCLVGASASAFTVGGSAGEQDARLVQRMLESVGAAGRVPEDLMDAVTGLSGSGPAYVYVFIEALSDAGVRVGLPRDIATRLAAQTVFGAAKMVLETGQHPAALKDAVASPGGTTIAGLEALERSGLRTAAYEAVRAATQRSIELGRGERH